MKTISELITSMFETSRDRVKNPITGAFMFSWVIVNWRIVLILVFSAKTVEEKIAFIEANYINVILNFWLPLAVAFFYALILPYIMALFDWLLQKSISYRRLNFKNNRVTEIQYKQEIAAEEWQLEKIRQGSPDIDGMKTKIFTLENQLADKDGIINKLTDQIDSISNKAPKLIGDDHDDDDDDDQNNIADQSNDELKPVKTNSKTVKKKSKRKTPPPTAPTINSYSHNADYPVMKDILIRDLPKTEREWLLIYALYSSDFGKNEITREDLLNKYNESNRKTDSRLKNLSNNINRMVKAGQLKFINDNEMLLTISGQEIAKDILNR